MQPYPRSPDLVWPGHLHGTSCLSARAVGTGFPTVVRRLCFGPVCGWVWVLLTPPVLAGVLGGCVWARFVVLSLFCRLFVVLVAGPRFRPAYGTCVVFMCAPLAPRCFRFRCAVWACVLGLGLGCAQPFLAGLSGCVFCVFFFLLCGILHNFPQKIVKYGSFAQILIPCNNQLPSTIAPIQKIHIEGFQGFLRSRVDTQQLLSTRRSSHLAHGDTGVGHVHRIASIE